MTDKSNRPKASDKSKLPTEANIQFLDNDLKRYIERIQVLEKENFDLTLKLAVYKEYMKRNVFNTEEANTDF